MHNMKNKIKTLGMLGLASILLAMPLKKSNAGIFDKIFDKYWSLGIEYSVSQPDYSEIKQINEEKNNQLKQYIPDFIAIPNPEQLEMKGILFSKPIRAVMTGLIYDIEPEALVGIYGGESKADYSQSYSGDYRQIDSNESISTLEMRLGLKSGKVKRLHSFSYSASIGFTFDRVAYSKSRTTTFSDSTSGEIRTVSEGTGAGYFINIRGEYIFSTNMSAEAGIGIKRSTVKTCGAESFTDSSDSSNNYEIYRETAVGLDGTEYLVTIKYNF